MNTPVWLEEQVAVYEPLQIAEGHTVSTKRIPNNRDSQDISL
jgi:hypothetical protein